MARLVSKEVLHLSTMEWLSDQLPQVVPLTAETPASVPTGTITIMGQGLPTQTEEAGDSPRANNLDDDKK